MTCLTKIGNIRYDNGLQSTENIPIFLIFLIYESFLLQTLSLVLSSLTNIKIL